MVNAVPESLLEIMRPQAVNSRWIVEGMLNGDKKTVLQALHNDPQCAHLKPQEVRAMGEALIEANRAFVDLPF